MVPAHHLKNDWFFDGVNLKQRRNGHRALQELPRATSVGAGPPSGSQSLIYYIQNFFGPREFVELARDLTLRKFVSLTRTGLSPNHTPHIALTITRCSTKATSVRYFLPHRAHLHS